MGTRGKGSVWASEWKTVVDPVSGATIRQLTDHYCHSYHLYFTEPGWYDGGRQLLIHSERENRRNLFGVDLETGTLTQLTDIDPKRDGELAKQVSVHPATNQAYFYVGATMRALDLGTLAEREIYRRPEGYLRGSTSPTADGAHVVTFHIEDLSDRMKDPGYVDYVRGRKGGSSGVFQKMVWEARPHCTITQVAADGSGARVVYEENAFLNHVNPSPVLPSILTFCHEGPWNLVEHRIWGLNTTTGEVWKIRPQQPDEAVGHEYWMADGVHIGYHGRTPGGPIYGAIRYDNTEQVEAPFSYGSTHFHSLSLDTIVGDGSRTDPYLLLWRFHDGQFEGPKVLAWHRGSMHVGHIHAHPTMSTHAPKVCYAADPQGYCQVYLADLPDFDALPDRTSI
jgi:oligogalacturonide lyase